MMHNGKERDLIILFIFPKYIFDSFPFIQLLILESVYCCIVNIGENLGLLCWYEQFNCKATWFPDIKNNVYM